MAKYHDSGTICKASKRPCPLGGDDEHIDAENTQDFEKKLAEKIQAEDVVEKSSDFKLEEGSEVIGYESTNTKLMRRYGTSSSVVITRVNEENAATELAVDVYNGSDLKPEVLIEDSLAKLKEHGVTGKVIFDFTAKYGRIDAHDPEDEDSDPYSAGVHNIEVGYYGVTASTNID